MENRKAFKTTPKPPSPRGSHCKHRTCPLLALFRRQGKDSKERKMKTWEEKIVGRYVQTGAPPLFLLTYNEGFSRPQNSYSAFK